MTRSAATNSRRLLLACAATLAVGCTSDGDGNGGGDGETGADTSSTGATTGDPGMSIELRPDLCDDPANAALVEGLLAAGNEEDPSYGQRNPEQLERMLEDPLRGPFYMVNLIRYREHAVYPDGRDSDLSGEEANALYAPLEFLEAIGANVVFTGPVTDTTFGAAGEWDDVSIVEYPCPLALFAMGADPEFQERAIHKDAGLEASFVMVTHRRELGEVGQVDDPWPTTAEDPSFEHVQVVRRSELADYGADAGEPERSGEEALGLYAQAFDAAGPSHGVLPRARLDVQGVFVGDGRDWHEVWIDYAPSSAAWGALNEDPGVVEARHHFDAAVQEGYGLAVQPVLSMIPGAAEGGGGGGTPVTPDGTGTPCEVDADCPGDGVDTCLNPDGQGGFCTREGCGSGECEDPYVCCRDCSEAIAPMLPFDGAACLPSAAAEQLSQAPASCTCD
ncbi:MAG: hypothetical protein AAF799_42175 [Myxococcota bacterium]